MIKFNIHKTVALLAFVVAASGCSTMHFHNGQGQVATDTQSEWHHTAVLSLWEVSSPVDMKQKCNGKDWTVVTTKKSFSNGLIGVVESNVLMFTTGAPGVELWSPWTVDYACK